MAIIQGQQTVFNTSMHNGASARGQAAAQRDFIDGSAPGFIFNCFRAPQIYTDAAGTVGVTGVDQDVRSIRDARFGQLIGLSPDGGTLPVWKDHPTMAGAKALHFTSDAILEVDFDVPKSSRTIVAALRPMGGDARKTLLEAYVDGTDNDYLFASLELDDGTGDLGAWKTFVDVSNPTEDPNLTPLDQDVIVSLRVDYVDDDTLAPTEIRVNGVSVVSETPNPTNPPGSDPAVASGIRIGANRSNTRNMDFYLYGLAVVFDSVDPAPLEGWFAERCEVTLP